MPALTKLSHLVIVIMIFIVAASVRFLHRTIGVVPFDLCSNQHHSVSVVISVIYFIVTMASLLSFGLILHRTINVVQLHFRSHQPHSISAFISAVLLFDRVWCQLPSVLSGLRFSFRLESDLACHGDGVVDRVAFDLASLQCLGEFESVRKAAAYASQSD